MHRLIITDVEQAEEERRYVVIYLGDYLDRGRQSRQVIDRLINDPLPGFSERIHLMGNHEEALFIFLADPHSGPGYYAIGGDATLQSYGVNIECSEPPVQSDFFRAAAQFRQLAPKEHVAFIRGLEFSFHLGDYFFAHAGIMPGTPLEAQSRQSLLWIRNQFTEDARDHGKIIVHGHTIAPRPEMMKNRIGIDTGAYRTGVLTCLVLEGTNRRFISTDGTQPV
jgi:serine/threonine protein phosphatase 1